MVVSAPWRVSICLGKGNPITFYCTANQHNPVEWQDAIESYSLVSSLVSSLMRCQCDLGSLFHAVEPHNA